MVKCWAQPNKQISGAANGAQCAVYCQCVWDCERLCKLLLWDYNIIRSLPHLNLTLFRRFSVVPIFFTVLVSYLFIFGMCNIASFREYILHTHTFELHFKCFTDIETITKARTPPFKEPTWPLLLYSLHGVYRALTTWLHCCNIWLILPSPLSWTVYTFGGQCMRERNLL